MPGPSPQVRAAIAVAVLLGLLGGLRWARRAGLLGPLRPSPPPASESIGRTCFDVVGATTRPGLRCGGQPALADLAPLPPCADARSRRRIARLLDRCPLHGWRVVLAPVRAGGECRPRIARLAAGLRLALGIPLDLATAHAGDLRVLPGVGPATARLLEAARARGPPADPTSPLGDLPGLGEARRRRLEPLLGWEPPPPPDCLEGPADGP